MTTTTFGEHLRREREMRGVSLEEISTATRIATRFLEAMEQERWDQLPGGVFNRGFVRAVGRFLGLDEEKLVAEYALATHEQPELPAAAPRVAPRNTGERPRALSLVIAVVVLLALVAGGWLAWHRYTVSRADRQSSSTLVVESAPPDLVPAASLPATASAAAPGPSEPGASPAAGAGGVSESAPLRLTVAAGKTTQVKIIADGASVFDGKMTAGESQRFQARDAFKISAGNSTALLLELNGQTVVPMGPPGRPGKITLTRKDLKKPSGGPT